MIPVSHVGEFVKMVIDDSPTKATRTEGGTGGDSPQSHAGTGGFGNFCMDMSGSRSVGWWRTPRGVASRLPFRAALMYARRKDLQVLQNIGRAP